MRLVDLGFSVAFRVGQLRQEGKVTKNRKTTILCSTVSLLAMQGGLAIGLSGAALAQSDEASTAGRDVIVVTSRKREESLYDAPVAVTAFSGDEVDKAGFQSIVDIAQATPGFFFESYNTSPGRQDSVPYIRGVVFDSSDPLAQTVSVFVDGVFVAGGAKTLGNEDVERIEVIKGPQSAIFGRTTFAGAINYITRNPSDEMKTKLSVLAATRDEYEVTASVEGPLNDIMSARVSGRWSHNGGHYDNAAAPGQNLGHESTWSLNGTLFIEPTDNWTTKIRAAHTNVDDGPAVAAVYNSTFNNLGPLFPGGETIFAGQLADLPAPVVGLNTSDADFLVIQNILGPTFNFQNGPLGGFGLEGDDTRLSLQTSYDFEDLGVTFDAIVAYNNSDSTLLQDMESSPDNEWVFYNARAFEDFNAEARLSGSLFNETLDWSAGFSHFDIDYTQSGEFIAVPLLSVYGQGETTTDTVKTTAGFFQLSYAPIDLLRFSFEGRYQIDDVNNRGEDGLPVLGSPAKFKNFLPRATVDFKPFDGTLLYATYSEGNLPGGFNANFFTMTEAQQAEARLEYPTVSGNFEEEKLTNYEIGWKQTFSDWNLTLATAAFFMERSNQLATTVVQVTGDPGKGEPPLVSTTLTLNDATSEIKGVEFEGYWDPTDSLSFSATAAYVKTEITGFPEGGDAGDFTDVFGPDADFTGIEAARYPTWQSSFSATYTSPTEINLLGFSGNLFGRADLFYAGRYYLTNVNVAQSPRVTDLRLRTGFRADDFSIEFFATNVLNEDAPSAANNFSDLTSATALFNFSVEATQVGMRDRRQFGVRTSFEF